MKQHVFAASALFALWLPLFFAGCASAGSRPAEFADISGDWILSSIEYDASAYGGYSGAQVYIDSLAQSGGGPGIVLSADRSGESGFAVYGFSGVNSYSGFISLSAPRLMENPPIVTLAAGPAAAERFERFFLQALTSIASVSLSEDGMALVLSDDGGMLKLSFRRFTLEGTSWTLSAYNNGIALQSIRPAPGWTPSIAFGYDKNCTGSTGVNRMMGRYSSDAYSRSLSFSTLATTRMGAPSEEMAALESLFVKSLESSASYRISGASLAILSGEGKTLLVLHFSG